MNPSELASTLSNANVTNPFSYLGLSENTQGKGLIVRAWFPSATNVELIEFSKDRRLGQLIQVEQSGLFELVLPRRKNHFNYRFNVSYADSSNVVIDPYQFKQDAFYAVHYLSHQPENIYQQLGAQLTQLSVGKKVLNATRFAVFAPNASTCSLIGDFNHWDGRQLPMEKTQCGHFVIVVPELEAGVKYKFELKDQHGHNLPHKSDPVGFYQDQYPSFASVVYDHNEYQWQDEKWLTRKEQDYVHKPMAIYEVHLGSWRMKEVDGEFVPLSYLEMIDQLIPYVKEMGYTHIEVLPVSEHPFTGSWGYQPTAMFAPTSRFGDPDQFKAFVDACHQSDIGIIIDWVPAHFPEDPHGLARFDGTHVYEYDDPRKGWHPDWNSCIYDFGKDTVRQFLVSTALYWLDKFHIDALRVDAVASMLYLDYSREDGEWIPNVDGGNHNYEAISLLRWMNDEVHNKHPNALTIAEESTSFPKVSHPTQYGGLGFDFKWNMGWMHDSLTYVSKDPAYRNYHHNDITFAMVYNYDEHFVLPISHDEVVHGKGSLLRKMPGDEWQQAANQRCYAAFMYAHPGKKLNFMGNEIAQVKEWDHNSSINWHLLANEKHQGMQNVYKDLNHLYCEHAPLHQLDHEHAGFEWLDHQDAEQSVLAFARKDKDGNEIIVISNFTPIPRDYYRVGVTKPGRYKVLLNSDSEYYWGSNYSTGLELVTECMGWQGKEHSLLINLPPLSTLYITLT